jgi:hypothetical protein
LIRTTETMTLDAGDRFDGRVVDRHDDNYSVDDNYPGDNYPSDNYSVTTVTSLPDLPDPRGRGSIHEGLRRRPAEIVVANRQK